MHKTVRCHLSHTKEGWGRFLISHQNKNEWSGWICLLCLSQSRPYIKRSKVWFCRQKISRSLNLLFFPNSQSTSMESEYEFLEYCDTGLFRKDTFILHFIWEMVKLTHGNYLTPCIQITPHTLRGINSPGFYWEFVT